jgi:dTDP-4-amino-4,6-dideoxy-D-galactose acyltransferase
VEKPSPFTCTVLPWDTQFFGRRLARLSITTPTPPEWNAVADGCRAQNIEGLYFACPPENADLVRFAETQGFGLMDIRLELVRPLNSPVEAMPDNGVRLRQAQTSDLPALQALARSSHRNTRFFRDSHFPVTHCEKLYETWITKSVNNASGVVWVAGEVGQPVSYCTGERQADDIGRIGLLAVAAEQRRLGFGRQLVLQTLAWFQQQGLKRASVVTQGGGVPAQRLYQQCGFVTAAVALWYHKWFCDER